MGRTVTIIADRLGWEERQLADRLRVSGMHGKWVNDEDLCLGLPKVNVPDCNLALIRSRSYVRGRFVATLLAEADMPTLNNPEAIACCENKMDLLRALHRANIPIPAFRLVLSRKDLSRSVGEFGLPMVVKPLFGGLG
jgi:[lysine-biosynthesis-protein LysW]---L-2-aminoadipate ligase